MGNGIHKKNLTQGQSLKNIRSDEKIGMKINKNSYPMRESPQANKTILHNDISAIFIGFNLKIDES